MTDVIEALKDFFFIERGYLNGNHFIFRSPDPVLIDTGYSTHLGETKRILAELHVDPAHVALIVNTHTHSDHVGGNRMIQELSGCGVALHKRGRHFIETGDDWSTWWRYYHQEAEFFRPTIGLEDGDRIDIGPYEWEVIHAPGHASDGIVLYCRQHKTLISSDTLWERDIPVVTVRVEGSACLFHWLESLEKIEGLEVDIVYPGHGSAFRGFRQAVDQTRKRIHKYLLEKERVGDDLLKRIMVFTLLMKKKVGEDVFFADLMQTVWFRETVDFYFSSEYERKYRETVDLLAEKKVIIRSSGCLAASVKA